MSNNPCKPPTLLATISPPHLSTTEVTHSRAKANNGREVAWMQSLRFVCWYGMSCPCGYQQELLCQWQMGLHQGKERKGRRQPWQRQGPHERWLVVGQRWVSWSCSNKGNSEVFGGQSSHMIDFVSVCV